MVFLTVLDAGFVTVAFLVVVFLTVLDAGFVTVAFLDDLVATFVFVATFLGVVVAVFATFTAFELFLAVVRAFFVELCFVPDAFNVVDEIVEFFAEAWLTVVICFDFLDF